MPAISPAAAANHHDHLPAAPQLGAFADVGLTPALLRLTLDEQARRIPRQQQLWGYYRNALQPVSTETNENGRWYRQPQERGLPARIVGAAGTTSALTDDRNSGRREVVVENDIAWRVQAMVDFMFGKPVSLVSTAADERLRATIKQVLDRVWEASGGIALLQDAALLGHVFGHVDLILRVDDDALRAAGTGAEAALRATDALRVEVVEPRRGVPILDPHDYRRLKAYLIHSVRDGGASSRGGVLGRVLPGMFTPRREQVEQLEIISANAWQAYENGRLAWERTGPIAGGDVPVVHIQNISQPFEYEGLGEVEPLIPLQDELNTRLSDRASRVTLQNFKMYLAKGIDGFEKVPVGPGQLISTDNPNASIQEFGADSHSPSEESHIQQVRDAMDKVSGLPPLASGVVQAKIGSLSSANALRITLMGVLSKTARKRVTYGSGIARMSALILAALDQAGVLATRPQDRGVRLTWPDPLPEDTRDQAIAAEAKAKLGVPPARVLAELGYAPTDPGIA